MSICQVDKNGYCDRHKKIHYGRFLELALMDNEVGESHRKLWDEQLKTQENPSLLQQAKNLTKSTINYFMAGKPRCTEEEYKERINTCDKCDYVDKSNFPWTCKLCGCPLQETKTWPGKAWWKTEECPDKPPRWKKLELPVLPSNYGCSKCPKHTSPST